MEMRKINERIYEFWDLDYVSNDGEIINDEDLIDSDEIESVEVSDWQIGYNIMRALDQLTDEEIKELGLF